MPYSWNIGQLLAKAEGTEGTAETLTASEGTILVRNVTVDPDVPFHNRGVVTSTVGDFKGTAGGPRLVSFSFEMPLCGSGTAGTAPPQGLILQSGGFSVTNVPGTSDTYKPSTTYQAITLAFNVNGLEFKGHGCRVSKLGIGLDDGGIPIVSVEALGVYDEPSAVAAVVPTYLTTIPVAICGGAMTLDSVALKYSRLSIDVNNDVAVRPSTSLATGAFSIHAAPGSPHITGSIDPETEVPGTYNFFNKMTTNTTGALSLVIGATAGNIITITAPAVQWTGLKPERREHTLIYSASLLFCRSSGNDALLIVFT